MNTEPEEVLLEEACPEGCPFATKEREREEGSSAMLASIAKRSRSWQVAAVQLAGSPSSSVRNLLTIYE